MKIEKLLLIAFIIGLFGCQNKKNEVVINVKIDGKYPQKVEYTTPIDGKWFYGDKKSITTDSLGTLQIKMGIEKPSFVTLYASGKAGILLVEPGKTYDTEFEIESNQKKFNITSEHNIGQNFYNTLPAPDFNIYNSENFLNDSVPSKISSKIDIQREKQIAEFNNLLKKGEISKGFHELAVLDRNSYFLALESTIGYFGKTVPPISVK